MPKKAANAVNEFDDAAWNAAFSQMTEDRKDDDAGSIATKDAMAVVDKIFDDMKNRYFDHLDVMQTSVEQFGKVSRLARCFTHLDRALAVRCRGGECGDAEDGPATMAERDRTHCTRPPAPRDAPTAQRRAGERGGGRTGPPPPGRRGGCWTRGEAVCVCVLGGG